MHATIKTSLIWIAQVLAALVITAVCVSLDLFPVRPAY